MKVLRTSETLQVLNFHSLGDCQRPTFTLTPLKDKVTGVLGSSVTMQWDIKKTNRSDTINTARLELIQSDKSILLFAAIDEELFKEKNVKTELINRVSARIENSEKCLLTVTDLQYNDTYSFQLSVSVNRGDFNSDTMRVAITIEKIMGMSGILYYSSQKL